MGLRSGHAVAGQWAGSRRAVGAMWALVGWLRGSLAGELVAGDLVNGPHMSSHMFMAPSVWAPWRIDPHIVAHTNGAKRFGALAN